MQIITDLNSFSCQYKETETAVCIGNFDGLHLGHQKIILQMTAEAKKSNLLSVVLSFQSNTRRWKNSVGLLSSFDEKVALIRACGVDLFLALPFPGFIAAQSPHYFVLHVLKRCLKMKACYVGEDFRFGKDRKGTVTYLESFSRRLGYALHVSPMLIYDGQTVSSTVIRNLLNLGRVDEAAKFLGRPYEIEGLVVRGHGRGKALGFPTANLLPLDSLKCIPGEGIYLSEIDWVGKARMALTHVGPQPTFKGLHLSIETHILDFNETLYHRNLRVRFIKKIRDIFSFNDSTALIRQIQEDIETAKNLYDQ
jgi:riboflavin kinase / FMN adenylyltransferase